jgi:hypothetical protein
MRLGSTVETDDANGTMTEDLAMTDQIDRRRGPCPLCGRDAEIARTIVEDEPGHPTLGGTVAVGCSTFGCGNYIDPDDLGVDWPKATEPGGST